MHVQVHEPKSKDIDQRDEVEYLIFQHQLGTQEQQFVQVVSCHLERLNQIISQQALATNWHQVKRKLVSKSVLIKATRQIDPNFKICYIFKETILRV